MSIEAHLASTVREALAGHRDLAAVSDSPLLDCQLILAHALGVSRSWLYAHTEHRLPGRAAKHFDALMTQRKQGMPVAYITGRRWFWHMHLEVGPETLVPRPETELLVEAVLGRLDAAPRRILDAGTGTGAIAIALAAERPAWHIFASDLHRGALAVAARNSARHAPGVCLLQGDWLAAIAPASLDALVCNPPYVAEGDAHLDALRHEPCTALTAGEDGLDAIRRVLSEAIHCLRPGGLVVMEHGFDQQAATRQLATRAGFSAVETLCDLNGQPRALVGVRRQ